MPTLEEIRARAVRVIHDPVYVDDVVDEFINEGLQRCASLVLLPDLMSTGIVLTSTTAFSVAIPTSWNFDRNVYLCSTVSDKRRIEVFSSVILLANKYPDFNLSVDTGEIDACTATRTQFIYYPVPTTAENLICAFYKKPTLLTTDTVTPDILPDFLHFDLLANYASFRAYNEIEQGIDDPQVNTKKYLGLFTNALNELAEYFKTGQSRPKTILRTDWI